MEGRAAVAFAIARETATTERGPPDRATASLYVSGIAIGNGSKLMEGRAAVASVSASCTATTERGPPKSHAVLGHDGAWPSICPYNMRAQCTYDTP